MNVFQFICKVLKGFQTVAQWSDHALRFGEVSHTTLKAPGVWSRFQTNSHPLRFWESHTTFKAPLGVWGSFVPNRPPPAYLLVHYHYQIIASLWQSIDRSYSANTITLDLIKM